MSDALLCVMLDTLQAVQGHLGGAERCVGCVGGRGLGGGGGGMAVTCDGDSLLCSMLDALQAFQGDLEGGVGEGGGIYGVGGEAMRAAKSVFFMCLCIADYSITVGGCTVAVWCELPQTVVPRWG